MRGYLLDPNTNDLVLDEGGRLIPIYAGADAAAQEIRTRLRMFRGEYFLDLRRGVPYWQEVLRKGVNLDRVKAIVREVILSVEGIIDVPKIEISLDRATRHATITWSARYQDGSPVNAPLTIAL